MNAKEKQEQVDRLLASLMESFLHNYEQSRSDFDAGRVDGLKAVLETLENFREN